MKQSEKTYAEKRVRVIVQKNLIRCECKEPDLMSHLCKAAIEGTLKPISSAKIKSIAEKRVIKSANERYGQPEFEFHELFSHPESYKVELAAHNVEMKQFEDANAAAEVERDAIIDRIWLDEFDDGKVAIAEAMKILPKH